MSMDTELQKHDALPLERFKLICGQFVEEDGPWSGWNGRLARPGRQLADRLFHRQNRYGYSIFLTALVPRSLQRTALSCAYAKRRTCISCTALQGYARRGRKAVGSIPFTRPMSMAG